MFNQYQEVALISDPSFPLGKVLDSNPKQTVVLLGKNKKITIATKLLCLLKEK
jgi:hypothetical protein